MRVGTAGLVAAAGLGVLAAFGPHIAAQAPTAAAGQITFTRDIAPILQRSCQNCHRPGSMAPMSFLTYQDARPWARAIKRKVTERGNAALVHRSHRRHLEVRGRPFAVRRRRSRRSWRGSTPARRKATPPTCRRPQFKDDDTWSIGTPDLVVTSVKHTVPADRLRLVGRLHASTPA